MPSAWDWFTGAGRARREATETAATNRGYINEGLGNQLGHYGEARTAAAGHLQPYAQQGQQANTAYGNLLGLNGGAAQGQAQQGWRGWNPNLQNDMNLATSAVARRMNAGGSYNSGLNALAQQRATQELGSRDFYNYNDRLQGQAQQGYGAASGLAGNEWNYANAAGNAQAGATQGLVGNNTNLGNALSAANISPMGAGLQTAHMIISALRGGGGGGGYGGGNNNYSAGGSNQLQSSNYNNGWGYFGGGR